MIMSTNGSDGEEEQRRQVLLAAGGQEDRLVAQADRAPAARSARPAARDPPGRRCCPAAPPTAIAGHAGQHQRHDQRWPAAPGRARRRTTVRRSPSVNGTRFHGRSRMVPGRAQNRMPPVIGLNLPASGPQEPATPIGFEQHRPEDDLLVDDRLVPPLRDVPERRQARGHTSRRDAAEDVEEHAA